MKPPDTLPAPPRDEVVRGFAPGALVGRRFLLERLAGAGGQGTVFRARDQVGGGLVALKLMEPETAVDLDRFAREAAILEDLDHPGIVRHVAHGLTPQGPYMAMEWLEGDDLGAVLLERRLTPGEGLILGQRVAEALGFAHGRGVVHRDVKPSNLLLPHGDSAGVKLLDFGVARAARHDRKLTCTGAVVGTPAYMAPEQIQAVGAPEPSADVFSLGCVLFECLTGHAAFEGVNLMARLAKILLQDAPRLRALQPDAPADLERLLARMLAKDPQKRPQDGGVVAAELAAIAARSASWGSLTGGAGGVAPRHAPTEASPEPSLSSLTRDEQRLVTLVLAGDPDAATDRSRIGVAAAADLRSAIAAYGGQVDALAGGSLIVTTWGAGSALDRAERAAHCALALKARFPRLPIAMASGRGRVAARMVEGDVLDEGVRALRLASPGKIRLDGASAKLLEVRFRVDGTEGSRWLRDERAAGEAAPVLLGRSTSCVGRSRELSMLKAMMEGCADESVATAVLITGPDGSGKSRLGHELMAWAGQRGDDLAILIGRGDSVATGSPFGVAADVLRRAAGLHQGEPLEARREKLAARLGRHVKGAQRARVIAFLGAMCGVSFPDAGDALRAAHDSPVLMGDSMRAAWEEWLAAECAAHPVLLVLEDLQWGDEATVGLVDAALRDLAERPLMALALGRPEVLTRFPRLWAGRHPQQLALGPLPRKACERLLTEALGDGTPAQVTELILERAAGNPFFLEELIRAVAAGRGDAFPDSVLAMLEARLDGEGDEAKRVLRAASVFGARFSHRGVSALLGDLHPLEVGDRLERLASREIIAPAGAQRGAEYVFRSAMVREAAYRMLTGPDRALGHRLAGAWLAQSGGAEALAIAEHHQLGGERGRAVEWYRRAAEDALKASDLEAALTRVEAGVQCGAAGQELGALRLVEAEACAWLGSFDVAEEHGAEAMALFPVGAGPWFRALTHVAMGAGKRGDFDGVQALVGPASAAPPSADALGARLACLHRIAGHLTFGGRYAAADALLVEIDAAAGDPAALAPQDAALYHEVRAIRATVGGDLGAGLDGFRASLAAYELAGDRRNASSVQSSLGFVLTELGGFAGAEEALRAVVSASERLGLHDLATNALHNLGRVLAYRGAITEARIVEKRALDAYTALGDPRLAGSARVYLAQIELLAGDLGASEREARAAAAALLATPPLPLRALALAILARALLLGGRAEEAFTPAREAYAQLEREGSLEEGEPTVRLAYAEALAARGLTGELGEVVAAARARLRERAGKISDPAWRESFLHAVPENARMLAGVG
jgi:tetratricopeptide (TPR) repeat protein